MKTSGWYILGFVAYVVAFGVSFFTELGSKADNLCLWLAVYGLGLLHVYKDNQ